MVFRQQHMQGCAARNDNNNCINHIATINCETRSLKNTHSSTQMIHLENLEIKKLNKDGLDTLMNWAKEEGWNPGLHDADAFWNTDPDGFYGFFHEDALIAGGAIISYNGEFGFMGLFIVHPQLRRQGIGNKLWHLRRDILLGRLKSDAAIGMDGVVAMQPFYEKGGFKKAFRDERYECTGQKMNVSSHITPLRPAEYEKIMDYDSACLGYKRKTFLKYWLLMPQSLAFQYSENNEILGYAVIRKVDHGYKIGPLFADNSQIGEELYRACLNSALNEPVYLDIPVINQNAVNLVNKYGASYVFECARMYHGQPPKMNISKVYGITSFELG